MHHVFFFFKCKPWFLACAARKIRNALLYIPLQQEENIFFMVTLGSKITQEIFLRSYKFKAWRDLSSKDILSGKRHLHGAALHLGTSEKNQRW